MILFKLKGIYDRGDNFLFDFDPNGFPFGSKSKGKLSTRSYHIHYERKWDTSFFSVIYLFSLEVR